MKAILKRVGGGRILLRLRRALDFGFRVELGTALAMLRYLKVVRTLPPLSADAGQLDCFMLLNQPRLWEGIWSLYSFRNFFGACRLVVLNDGSLKPESLEIIKAIFPGVSIPDVKANDREIDAYLASRGLERCRQWRQRFVFFRKLIDPSCLSLSDRMILLDSDCLHFRVPAEVKAWADGGADLRYIADINQYSLCAPPEVLEEICGAPVPSYFCAGYQCVPKVAVDLDRIERYLSAECFESQLSSGRFSHVAEQSLYAMLGASFGANVLPNTYATCPDPNDGVSVMGHFCGGTFRRTWFYTKGLPFAATAIGSSV